MYFLQAGYTGSKRPTLRQEKEPTQLPALSVLIRIKCAPGSTSYRPNLPLRRFATRFPAEQLPRQTESLPGNVRALR